MKDLIKFGLIGIGYLVYMGIIYFFILQHIPTFIAFACIHYGFSILYFMFIIPFISEDRNEYNNSNI